MLTVAIDVEHGHQSNAGTVRYSRGLADALRKRGDVDVIEVGNGHFAGVYGIRKKILTINQDLVWYPWRGRAAARAAGAQVYHCPTARAPLSRGRPPLIVTIQDLVTLRFPETMPRWSRIYSRATLRAAVRAADIILTTSQDTADDLMSLLGVSPDRIRVAHIGIDDRFFSPPSSLSLVEGPYILFVGTAEPRKNLHRLSAAVRLLRVRGFKERLVLAGGRGWGDELRDPDVLRLGRVPDENLPGLYANASCLAIPSLHEGFGLPALEAMASGTAVVAANTGALPEITAGAAVLVAPLIVSDIANGLERAIRGRETWVARGRLRAGQFRWADTAATVVSVYRELA